MNKVKEIKVLTGVTYTHVSSQHNPADIATRGKSPEELTFSIWWHGPIWLAKPVQQWPDSKFTDDDSLPEIESEIKGNKPSMKLSFFVGRIPLENLVKQSPTFRILMKTDIVPFLNC